MPRPILALLPVLALAACGGGGTSGQTGFDAAAIQDPIFSTAQTERTSTIAGGIAVDGGGGVAFSTTIDRRQGVLFATDLAPRTRALDAPASGAATMTGTYALSQATGVAQDDQGRWSGTLNTAEGDITLRAAFGKGTLTGGGDGLTVDGTITDGRLGGTVGFDGVTGTLDGIVGSRSAIGLFAGSGDGAGYAGGFVAAK